MRGLAKTTSHVDQPQPPVEGLMGLRYQESQRTHVGVREPAPTPCNRMVKHLEGLEKCHPEALTDNIGEAHVTAERRERE